VALELGKDLDEVRGISITDLSLLAVQLAERREREDRKWDERFGQVCATVANFAFGSHSQTKPEDFFRSLVKEEWITDEGQMQRMLMKWCAATGGTVKQKGS
jgi:hypothetical protein